MSDIRFIRTPEKRRIEEALKAQFGIDKLPYLLFGTGKEKIRGFSGHLSKEEIAKLARLVNIELIGLYILKQEEDFRLSFDLTQLQRSMIAENIIDITEEEFQLWIRGYDLIKSVQKATVVIKYKDYLLGCGKSNGEKIFNYVPKDRRIKTQIKN